MIHVDRYPASPVSILVCVILAALFSQGCNDDEISSYEQPKAPAHAAAAQPNPTPMSSGGAGAPSVEWDIPEGWREVESAQMMRAATFQIERSNGAPVEIAVTRLGGAAGGMLANINRWRGQIGLRPTTKDQLGTQMEMVGGAALETAFVDIESGSGADAKRVIGALIAGPAGSTWFVKTTDHPEALEAHKETIRAFAASFRAAGTDGSAPAPPPQRAATTPDAGEWTAPSHWKQDTGAPGFVLLAYDIESDAGACRFTITRLGGEGGGALANINRWRGQIGLGPVASLHEQDSIEVDTRSGVQIIVYDIRTDTDVAAAQSILAVMLPEGGATRFFKLTGPMTTVEQERDSFIDAVKGMTR